MSRPVDPRLQRLLGGDAYASLRKRLRDRFARAPAGEEVESFRISKLTSDEYSLLASLLGRPIRHSSSLQVDVGRVDATFRDSGIALSLRDALEIIDGPIANLAETRRASIKMWSDVLNACTHHALVELLQTPKGLGLLKRLSGSRPDAAIELCRRVEATLRRLPADAVTRSQLAAEVLGDAHALDGGRPAATLILTIWRRPIARTSGNKGFDEPEGETEIEPAERDRDVWAKAGVLVNELARPALFLNVPVEGTERYGQFPGEPVYASLRSLLRTPPVWRVAGRKVYVCENPNLVAIAADRWGSDCEPLVCTDGMPAAAQRCLLSQLTEAGASLHYHGDFDWAGVRIGNHMMCEHGAKSWRFDAVDYVSAVEEASELGQTLTGKASLAYWDGGLTTAMQLHGLSVAEEAVATSLLNDLRSANGS
ncbi:MULTISPECIES: TIGR02679 family protein [Bradyrhizobium]|uniref:TIGR02679 family protein n=1 Tax=Bradyrhizobium elkanii TaxID=29448 RepID=A0A4U6RZ75_BRAEL|nr:MULTISPECIES: TIGR02679 family protein [Bradyrhizobium]MTV18611.1 TIGR02679 family protein [Bradyrhizobium sp. BR2003]TKV77656.1 TIGR02679 family protein [Bradyrhizobium elkanii]